MCQASLVLSYLEVKEREKTQRGRLLNSWGGISLPGHWGKNKI